ncbi:MAG: rhomboid family intramembrane serine protease [Nitrososphaerales archaeon]
MNPDANYCRSCGFHIVSPDDVSVDRDSSVDLDSKKCSFCSKPLTGEDAMYFKCRYCDQIFCNEHRLPENHLCRSAPSRRNVPAGSASSGGGYWSTSGGGYWRSSSSRPSGSGFFNISKPGRNLAIAIVVGLVLGFIFNQIPFGTLVTSSGSYSLTLVDYFVQFNLLVYTGWVPPLLTSAIVVLPNSSGLLDVFFNGISVIWIDRLLGSTYTSKEYYATFIITALAGNLLTLLYGPYLISYGASGGIFGLLGGAVSADYARSGHINRSLLVWFLFIFVYSTFAGGVNVFAHLGGAVFGLVVGYVIGRRGLVRKKSYW